MRYSRVTLCVLFLLSSLSLDARCQDRDQFQEIDSRTLRCSWKSSDHTNNDTKWGTDLGEELQLANTRISAQNNSATLVLRIEVVTDTVDDASDSLSLYIDTDGSGLISSRDVAYKFTGKGGKSVVIFGPANNQTQAVTKFDVSKSVSSPHRIWELTIPLSDIDFIPGQSMLIGFRTISQTPTFDIWEPSGFPDFAPILIEHSNSRSIRYPTLLRLILSNKGVVVSSANAEVKRTVLPNGSVRMRYPDGTITTLARPGQESAADSQYPTPPKLPSGLTPDYWLNYHANELVQIIKRLSGNDQRAVDNLMNAEKGFTVWQRIAFRSRIIFKMTTQ